MLRAYVLIETQVGKVAHVAQALTKLDGVQLAEDLVGVGPKQQPVLEGGGLAFGGVADGEAGAGPDSSDRPPLGSGREPRASSAAEPAPGHLPDHRQRPGAKGGLEPAPSPGGLVVAEGSWDKLQEGHALEPTPWLGAARQSSPSSGAAPRTERWRAGRGPGALLGRGRTRR